MDDRELIDALGRGEPGALEAVVDRYAAYVTAVIANQLGTLSQPADVEELASDVFFSLWQSRQSLKTDRLRGWLAAAARNKARSFLRRKGDIPVSAEDVLLIGGDNASALLEARERTRVIDQALTELGEPDREIFLRRYYYSETVPAIAARLSMHPEAVKSRLRRGREKLKEILKREGYYEAEHI